ncbi:mitochondrial enolase superfamily member 1 [Grus japonensis]|uniref:Mitochondrial enolase superfamily member 1 n=1 Tax=Grus japonensis TaxID=30415 RepID=A0ABC9X1J4_GRUJA
MLRHMENKEVIGDRQHGFTKGKSYLTNLVAFRGKVTALVDKGSATDVIYLDSCKAFDTVPHDILVSKLERHGPDRWTTQWIRNWLDGRNQRVVIINGSMSKWSPVMSGVPQGSVLGPALFNIFAGDMDSGIKCTLRKFADSTKLVESTSWKEGVPSRGTLTGGHERWAHANLMKFNKAKCKVLHMGRGTIPSTTTESQLCPGLHQKQHGQKVEGGDSAPLIRSCETPPRVLHPALGSPV